ncbi:MAG: leucine-rich repeat protein [Bacillota bacterium]
MKKRLLSIILALAIVMMSVCFTFTMSGCNLSSDSFAQYELNDDGESYSLLQLKENTSITSIVVPDTYNGLPVTQIVMPGISNTSTLESITIGANVEYIDAWGISLNTYLKEIIVSEDNQYYSSIDGILYDKEGTTLIVYPNASQAEYSDIGALIVSSSNTTVNIKEGVTTISKLAFYKCYAVYEIVLPDSVTTIEKMAFMGCSNLTSITLNNGLLTIAEDAFLNCSSLPTIDIPSSVTAIGQECFYGCGSLKTINIYASADNLTLGYNWQPRVGGVDTTCTISYL